ncbi:MAG: hypothetical protein M3542_02485 [Acidobacteriota bacterium]|nr:hypothetical protein [Acidobacteriota bacterium]
MPSLGAVEAPQQTPNRHIATIAVVSPTVAVARAFAPRIARLLPGAALSTFSLERFLSDRRAPARIVLCPAGESLRDDVAFLKDAHRRALWPRPGVELSGAIAGLRGSHDEPRAGTAPSPAGRGRTTAALLLEGDVTPARAERAAASGAPRHWIVERVQRVRISPAGFDELRRLGIRWSALEPVEVIALAASPELARAPSRWASRLPPGVPVWTSSPAGRAPKRRRAP